MSASSFVRNFCSVTSGFPNCRQNQTLVPTHHQFQLRNPLLRLKKQPFHSITHFKSSRTQKPRTTFVVFAAQSNFLKVLQNAWRVGRDGIEAGTNLVPATIGLSYFAYLAFNKDQGPRGNQETTSTPMDDPVEEARKIMEKYK
ncbi:hypothetical protein V8G54_021209 [Vigna mungo]|uniref:Uncharacterized protein n=1 Tax=Vigna mungo TaxID=3915 RepID=A0AAQ3RWN4_VIGMU